MRSILRALAVGAILAVIVLMASLSAQTPDPILGTWKLNPAKSKYDPGPPPKETTVTFAAVGRSIKIVAKGIDGQGNQTATEVTASYDGKDYPITGSPDYDTVAYR